MGELLSLETLSLSEFREKCVLFENIEVNFFLAGLMQKLQTEVDLLADMIHALDAFTDSQTRLVVVSSILIFDGFRFLYLLIYD